MLDLIVPFLQIKEEIQKFFPKDKAEKLRKPLDFSGEQKLYNLENRKMYETLQILRLKLRERQGTELSLFF